MERGGGSRERRMERGGGSGDRMGERMERGGGSRDRMGEGEKDGEGKRDRYMYTCIRKGLQFLPNWTHQIHQCYISHQV